MNSGKLEAVQTDHRRKIGSVPQKNCAGKLSESTKDQITRQVHELKDEAWEKAGLLTNNTWRLKTKPKSSPSRFKRVLENK
jgi:hypothetical protein